MWGPFVHTQLLTGCLLPQCDTRINAWHPREGGRHCSAVEHSLLSRSHLSQVLLTSWRACPQ